MSTANAIKATGIDLHAYLVKAPKRAIAFYKDNLGLTPSTESEQGAEFELADGTTFGVWKLDDGTWHASSGVFFAVPDIEHAVNQFRSRGVKVLEEISDSPVCKMAAVEDSEGNIFILHQRKAAN